jgi:uncharacterized membrane protein YhfC
MTTAFLIAIYLVLLAAFYEAARYVEAAFAGNRNKGLAVALAVVLAAGLTALYVVAVTT